MNKFIKHYQTHQELTNKISQNRNELPTSENGNTPQPNNAQPKVNQESLKRIMNSEMSTLPR